MINKVGVYQSVIVLSISFLIFSCTGYNTKESYLAGYKDFILEISQNSKNYDDKEWQTKTEQYEKFSGEWYEKFEDEFTFKERSILIAHQVKFNYYRTFGQSTQSINDLFELLNVKEIKEKAQYYIDNDMQSDLQKLREGAQKAGSEAEKIIEDTFKDLNVEFDD